MYSKAFEGCAAHGAERSIHCIYIYINIGGSVRSAARLGGDLESMMLLLYIYIVYY